jgi:hypothetical protein
VLRSIITSLPAQLWRDAARASRIMNLAQR